MPFTKEELEEMRRADEEIERNFRWTNEELRAARQRDREAKTAGMDAGERRLAERQKAYYEANREKVAEYQKAYREANREKVAERQRWIREARKERGYTQGELARRIGVSQPVIARLESGEALLDHCEKKEELCALLGR